MVNGSCTEWTADLCSSKRGPGYAVNDEGLCGRRPGSWVMRSCEVFNAFGGPGCIDFPGSWSREDAMAFCDEETKKNADGTPVYRPVADDRYCRHTHYGAVCEVTDTLQERRAYVYAKKEFPAFVCEEYMHDDYAESQGLQPGDAFRAVFSPAPPDGFTAPWYSEEGSDQ